MFEHTTTPNWLPAMAGVVSAVIIAGAALVAVQSFHSKQAFTDKALAVQGCFEVARGVKRSSGQGDSAANTWTVDEPSINMTIVRDCLEEKGY